MLGWGPAHPWPLETVSEPAGIWWHSFPALRCQQKGVTRTASTCLQSVGSSRAWGPSPRRCVPTAVPLPAEPGRAPGALRGLHRHGHRMGRGGCSGLCGPRARMISAGPFQLRVWHFDCRAVPAWLLVARSRLAAPAPAPQAELGAGEGAPGVRAGSRLAPGAWGRAGMGREAPGLGRAGSRTGDDVWADVSDRTR